MTRPLLLAPVAIAVATFAVLPMGQASAQSGLAARVIAGTVSAPRGQDLTGAKVLACLTPRETCRQEAEAPLTVQGGEGRFQLTVPVAGDYHVMVWKDSNRNGTPDVGDIMAFAHNMEAVPSGQRLSPMESFVRTSAAMTTNRGGDPIGPAMQTASVAGNAAATPSASAGGGAGSAGGLSGRWSQSSAGSELVWTPEIKFQPTSATTGFGTNLGGTFGAGSATNTTIVYSYKPMNVRRNMSLNVQPDGSFTWTITLQRDMANCRSLRQEKSGRVVVRGDQATFTTTSARQACDGAALDDYRVEPETYTVVRNGRSFRLTGSQTNWSFNPG